MTGLQVLTVTEHDDGTFDARVDEWLPGADEPISDTLVDVVVEEDSYELSTEVTALQTLAEGLHEDHAAYLDAMREAGYPSGMDFEAWQRNSGSRVPATMSDHHASTHIAQAFGPTVPATLGIRWAGVL